MRADRLTVLVVDDDAEIVRLLGRQLSVEHEVLSAADGLAALEILKGAPVDIVISDVQMPKLGGHDLILEIKQRYPHVVRLMVTAHGSLESAVKAINQGEVFRYLTKPWRSAELFEVMRAAGDRAREAKKALAQDHQALLAKLELRFPGIGADLPTGQPYRLRQKQIEDFLEQAPDEGVRLLGGG